MTTLNVPMQQRRNIAANWTSSNPVLLSGQIGIETDTNRQKFGDGLTQWNALSYATPQVDGIYTPTALTGAAITTACSAASSARGRVRLSGGDYAVTANANFLGVPLEIEKGSRLVISSGVVVSGLCVWGDPDYQIISCALANVPIITNKSVISPVWFGAVNCANITPVDSSLEITKANRSAYLYALAQSDNRISQTVKTPSGKFYVGNTSIKMYQHHSFIGSGNYHTTFVKMAGTTGAVIECEQVERQTTYTLGTNYGDFRILGIGAHYANPFDPSTYRGVDPTNHGLVLNWYRGADQISVKNILVSFCGGNFLRIVEGGGVTNAEFVTVQHSVFENIKGTFCNNGAYIKGFITDNAWIKCTFDPTDYDGGNVRAFELDYVDTKRLPWDNTFYSCSFQHADYGFHCDYMAFGVKIVGAHFEYNKIAHAFLDGANVKSFDFDSCTFQLSPQGILLGSTCGSATRVTINACRWWVWDDNSISNRFIKDLAGQAEIYIGPGQYIHVDTGMTQHVEVPTGTQKIHGYINPVGMKMGVRVPFLKADVVSDFYLDPTVEIPTITPYLDYVATTERLLLSASSGDFANFETITGATSGITATIVKRSASNDYWIVDRSGPPTAGETLTGSVTGVTGTYSSLSSKAITNLAGGVPGQVITVHARGASVNVTGNLKLLRHLQGVGGSLVLRRDGFSNWQEVSRKEAGSELSFTMGSDATTLDFRLASIARVYLSTTNAQTITLIRGLSATFVTVQLQFGGSIPTGFTWVNGNTGGGAINWSESYGAPTSFLGNKTYTFVFHKRNNDYFEVSRSFVDTVITTGDVKINVAGKGLRVKEGSNAKMGRDTLVDGTVVVSNTSVTANSEIFLTCQTPGGTTGFLSVSARTAGTSFTILSSSATDTSIVAWFIVEPS